MSSSNRKASWSTNLIPRILLGQFLACCIALTGLFSSLLATRHTSVALLQSTTAYLLIFLVAGPIHYHYSKKEFEEARISHVAAQSSLRSSSNNNNNHQQETSTSSSNHEEPSPRSTSETMNLITTTISTRGGNAPFLANTNNINNQNSIFQVGIKGVFQSHFPVWRYFALACCDVAASFFAIKAYLYTDITSAQLLDASTIFTVMILGYFFLKRRFNWRHFIGVLLALGGMVGLVFLDASGKSRNSDKTAPDAVLGDAFTLIASVLYGVTNIGCESLLKSGRVEIPGCLKKVGESCSCCGCVVDDDQERENETTPNEVSSPPTDRHQNQEQQENENRHHEGEEEEEDEDDTSENNDDNVNDYEGTTENVKQSFNLIVEYVSFISLFGFILSLILLLSLSYQEVVDASQHWDWKSTMFQIAFCCVMVASYIGLPSLLKLTNATFACLSLLTADMFAVLFDFITTGVAPKGLYYLCAVAILGGVLIFDTAQIKLSSLKKCCC